MNMKRLSLFVFLAFLLGYSPQAIHAQVPTPLVYFSPKGGCTEAIVQELNKAQKSILVQAYSFTSDPIAEGLIDAHQRGVKVEVLMGKRESDRESSQAGVLAENGVPVKIDNHVVHSKVMVIDEEIVITGSFNFTPRAERNLENLLIIRDKVLAGKYIKNFRDHEEHSKKFE